MSSVRVLAVGSPFENDNLAWQVSDQLQAAFPDVDFIKLDRPGTQLIDYLQNAEYVVVMDSLAEGHHKAVLDLSLEQLQGETRLVSSHGLGVAETLQLAQAMQMLPKALRILGLSPDVNIAVLADGCQHYITVTTDKPGRQRR